MKKPKRFEKSKRARITESAYSEDWYNNFTLVMLAVKENIQILTQMSFEDASKFEIWLFISILLFVPLTSNDVFDCWPYLNDNEVTPIFPSLEGLKQGVMDDVITRSEYIKIGRIIIKRLKKTNICPDWKISLLLCSDDVQAYFGRLALISYYLNRSYEAGELKRDKIDMYTNMEKLESVFGDLIKGIERNNVSVRRMNRTFYEQSGCSPMRHKRLIRLERKMTMKSEGTSILWWEHESCDDMIRTTADHERR